MSAKKGHSRPSTTISPRSRRLAALALAVVVLGFTATWALLTRSDTSRRSRTTEARVIANWPSSPWKNANLSTEYVGDAVCARCHAEIAESYHRHPMGRSMTLVENLPPFGGEDQAGGTSFEAGSSTMTIERRNGRTVHRESRNDERGRAVAEVAADVKYAVGSGAQAVSFLVEHEGRIFQSPATWYSRKASWGLSPGYDRINSHFDREVVPGCLFCHANGVEPVALATNLYQEPISRGGLAIGCERCHGPGALHARRPEIVDGHDRTIVNPRHLEPVLREAVCEQCHLLGDQRVDRAGREPFDFRPGLALTDFIAVFDRVREGSKKFGGHVEQMHASACFRGSAGRFGCISCHDPHVNPLPEERQAYYRERCMNCHETKGCSLAKSEREARQAGDSCIECHMPRFPKTEITHVASTDHRVLRAPSKDDEAAVAGSMHEPYLVLAQAEQLGPEARAPLDRELGIALTLEGRMAPDARLRADIGGRAQGLLERALEEHPDDPIGRLALARGLRLQQRSREALGAYQQLLATTPDFEAAVEECSSLAIELRDRQAALGRTEQAVALNPWSAAFHERRAQALALDKQWSSAESAARESLRLDPFQPLPRVILIHARLQQKDVEGARAELAVMMGLNPTQRPALNAWFERERQAATQGR